MKAREFSIDVVRRLQAAGYTAFWAGGCVRDQLLGRTPKDFDVATNATPDQVRDLFGHKRTLPIGAAFGVITVVGPKSAGQIEVATFRRDSGYSDGRHPDAVEFTDAREDAIRRDYTINGMFYDPLTESVIDHVGGQDDLNARVIRAIGEPAERIDEDKLRMLRGIRFGATFDFEIDPETFEAIRQHASEIEVVSAERIGAEVQSMFNHANRVQAVELLLDSGLLKQVLPPKTQLVHLHDPDSRAKRLTELQQQPEMTFESFAVALLEPNFGNGNDADKARPFASMLQSAWRLTNDQRAALGWIAANYSALHAASDHPWPMIQRLLISAHAQQALDVANVLLGSSDGLDFCRSRLAWPDQKLNPEPLIDGQLLIQEGIKPGPTFKQLLNAVRDAQLNDEISTNDQAIKFAIDFARALAEGSVDVDLG